MARKLAPAALIVMVLTLFTIGSAFAARGSISWVNPPEKVGKIERTDDGSNNEYIFLIPQGLSDPGYVPQEGHAVDFETDPEPGRLARNVTKVDDPG